MTGPHKRQTKNYFINREFQGRIALTIFLAAIIGCLLFIGLLAFLSSDTLTISYSNNDLKLGKTPWMLLKSAAAANWLFLLVGGTLLVLAAIIGTHRIAGPLHRLERRLAKMAQGDLSTDIVLREKDEGKELAHLINELSSIYSEKLRAIERSSDAVHNLLNQYDSLDGNSISTEDATSVCKAIRTYNDKVRTQTEYFNLKAE